MADGSVTAYTGKCELGQGLFTAQVQLIAEELVVPMNRVTLVQCDTVADARSGHDVRRAVAPGQLQPRESRAGRRHRPRGARAAGGRAPRRPGRAARRRRRRRLRARRRRASGSATAISSAAAASTSTLRPDGEAPPAERVDGARHSRCRASTCRRWSPPSSSTCTTCACPGMLHGRVVRPPAVGATSCGSTKRSVAGMAGVREGRRQGQLRRRRRREAVAGHAGGGEARR